MVWVYRQNKSLQVLGIRKWEPIENWKEEVQAIDLDCCVTKTIALSRMSIGIRMILCLKHKTDNVICVMVPLHSYFRETSHIFLRDAPNFKTSCHASFRFASILQYQDKGSIFKKNHVNI